MIGRPRGRARPRFSKWGRARTPSLIRSKATHLRPIGIGGRVAPSPLPHHRTCGSASGGSVPARLSDLRFAIRVSVPCSTARGITPTLRRKGQHPLFGPVFLPLSTHESRRLLALSFIPLTGTVWAFDHRSRLGLSCLLRLSALECLTSLADCVTYFALC